MKKETKVKIKKGIKKGAKVTKVAAVVAAKGTLSFLKFIGETTREGFAALNEADAKKRAQRIKAKSK